MLVSRSSGGNAKILCDTEVTISEFAFVNTVKCMIYGILIRDKEGGRRSDNYLSVNVYTSCCP